VHHWIQNNCVDSINNLAIQFLQGGDYDNAVKYFLIAIKNNCTIATYNIGMCYSLMGDDDLAIKYWFDHLEHSDAYVRATLRQLEMKGCVDYGILYCNRALNRTSNNAIMEFVLDFVNTLNADMVNIIVNMDMTVFTHDDFTQYQTSCSLLKLK